MDKKTYYISVQAGTALEDKEAAAFEFEIQATEEDIDRLSEMFEDRDDANNHSWLRAHTPAVPYHIDGENDNYDYSLKRIYETIHTLGTPETKAFIERMGVL